MTSAQKTIKTKVGLLELTKQLGNVADACRIMGYSRDSFYRFPQARARRVSSGIVRARKCAGRRIGICGVRRTTASFTPEHS